METWRLDETEPVKRVSCQQIPAKSGKDLFMEARTENPYLLGIKWICFDHVVPEIRTLL